MRKIVVSEFVSLDGVMEDPGGAEKFVHGGWTWPYWGDDIGKFKYDEMNAADALLLGRTTYQGFAAAWPNRKDEPGADKMNNFRKYVVSASLKKSEWENTHVIQKNFVEEVAKIKQEPGKDILVYGSAQLVQGLMEHKLVDEFRLVTYPIVLGSGKRLFAEVPKTALKLVETKNFTSGVALLTYHPEG